MTVVYHPVAADELLAAAAYYRSIDPELGEALLDNIDIALARLLKSPEIGQADSQGRRRWWIRRFPYLIIYRISGETIFVLAIAHTSRLPTYWAERD